MDRAYISSSTSIDDVINTYRSKIRTYQSNCPEALDDWMKNFLWEEAKYECKCGDYTIKKEEYRQGFNLVEIA